MQSKTKALAVCAGATVLLLASCGTQTEAPAIAEAPNGELGPYKEVTADRLRNPEDGDWLSS